MKGPYALHRAPGVPTLCERTVDEARNARVTSTDTATASHVALCNDGARAQEARGSSAERSRRHSSRSARIGSIHEARRAGAHAAKVVTARSSSAMTTKIRGLT